MNAYLNPPVRGGQQLNTSFNQQPRIPSRSSLRGHAHQNPNNSYLNDSINQRDMSVDVLMRGDYVDPRKEALQNDYNTYLKDVNSSFKNKKTRAEIEREKQMQRNDEVGIAQKMLNSRAYADFQQKQYFRNVTSSPQRTNSAYHSPFTNPQLKSKAADLSPLVKNGQMIMNSNYQYGQQSIPIGKPQTLALEMMNPTPQQPNFNQYNPNQFTDHNNYPPPQQYSSPNQIPPQQYQPQMFEPQTVEINPNIYISPQMKQGSMKQQQDLNASMGPPSGMNNPHYPPQQQYSSLSQEYDPNSSEGGFKPSESFKNPWTTIPRPMNGFMEITEIQYERHEKEKQDLSKVLQDQIEDKKRREQEEKKKKIQDELYFEQRLARERLELEMREKMEKEAASNKVKTFQLQNQVIIEQKKEKIMRSPPPQPEPVIQVQKQQEIVIEQRIPEIIERQVVVQQPAVITNNIDESKIRSEIVDLQKTFKGELEGLRQVIKQQEGSLKQEVTKIIETTKQSGDQEKNKVAEELQKLREEFVKQQEQKQEQQWDSVSRGVHWLKYSEKNELEKGKTKIITGDIKLKTILTTGYFGQDGVKKAKRLNQSYLLNPKSQKSEPLYQSSKMLDFSNFAINRNDELHAETIREANIDRLKLLQKYEENQNYKKNLAYYKYSENEEEDLNTRLMKMDKKLYYMLNPETERVKQKVVPYKLNSAYDYYGGESREIEDMALDRITHNIYNVS